MEFPPLIKIRRRFASPTVEDIPTAVATTLAGSGVSIRAGSRIAIACGSRGIANLPTIIAAVVSWVRSRGAEPFLVPAMGSHGGATPQGQQALLEAYGLTEIAVGAPICSSMDVIELPQGDCPVPVFFDRLAADADGTIVINRVKPHTSFHARYESGLMKMCAIGLGKHRQALAIHALGVPGLREVLPRAATQVLRQGNVILGVAIVENAYDETMLIRAIPAADIPRLEPDLLELARAHMPSLPVDDIDVLVVDEIGKNISGLGMDPNIIGRMKIPGQGEPSRPRIRMIVVRDLTEQTRGNALGIGLADVTTRRLFEKIDFAPMYENARTTTFLERAKIPYVAQTDAEALRVALRACGAPDPSAARVIRIRNTLRLEELYVSEPIWRDMQPTTAQMLPCGPPLAGEDMTAF